ETEQPLPGSTSRFNATRTVCWATCPHRAGPRVQTRGRGSPSRVMALGDGKTQGPGGRSATQAPMHLTMQRLSSLVRSRVVGFRFVAPPSVSVLWHGVETADQEAKEHAQPAVGKREPSAQMHAAPHQEDCDQGTKNESQNGPLRTGPRLLLVARPIV